MGLRDLNAYLTNTTFNLLCNQGVERPVAEEILHGILRRSPKAVERIDDIAQLSEDVRIALQTVLILTTSVLPTLVAETATEEELDQAARMMEHAGSMAEQIGDPIFAYNYYEIAWIIGSICDRPALSIAQKLRSLSNPEMVDQHHGSIWRLAIERFRKACDDDAGWSTAIDSVELALTCRIPHRELRLDLYSRLIRQVRRAEGTSLQEIVGIVVAQSPPTFNPAVRHDARLALARANGRDVPDGTPEGIIELFALAQGQVMLDDIRLVLEPDEHLTPEIVWTDLTYRDSRLASAVPAGRSLLVHLHRSGILLLDLAHEIAHAETLQGAIGLRQSAYRAVLNYIEFMLVDQIGNTPSSGEPSAVRELPRVDTVLFLASNQLRAATLADIERKVWRAWLEGVALYIELLCDPIEDPSEISNIHAAIRSMIDLPLPREEGEDEETFRRRLMEVTAIEFETFYAQALRLRSRPNHIAYFDIAHGRDASDLYCLGYLVVRSVVAAWEKTLGRRLPPAIASKLLLNSTKVGTFEMHIQPEVPDDQAASVMEDRYLSWVENLAKLSRESLEAFFEPVHRDSKGRPQIWQHGMPRTIDDAEAAQKHYAPFFERLHSKMRRLMGFELEDGTKIDAGEHPAMLDEVFEWYVEASRLLSIGSVDARMLPSEERPGWMALNVRTYVSQYPDHDDSRVRSSRYHLRTWSLAGGEEQAEALRRDSGKIGTDRLFTTRIIELNAHPASPYQSISVSYLVSFLGRSLKFIQPTGGLTDVADDHRDFAAVLERRMFPSYGIADEEETIADNAFLTERLRQIDRDNRYVQFADETARTNIALRVATAGAEKAFGASGGGFGATYNDVMIGADVRRSIALSLFETGRSERGRVLPEIEGTELARLIFKATSHSGVRPFGEQA